MVAGVFASVAGTGPSTGGRKKGNLMAGDDGLTDALVALGFSQYESRAYVGLLGGEYGLTAYALWKRTGVPQPKIYEALRKLVERGVAIQVGTRPQRFAPRQVDEVLEQLQQDFDSRVEEAKRTAAKALSGGEGADAYAEVLRGSRGKDAVLTDAAHLINDAGERLYISGWAEDLAELKDTIVSAQERGVQLVILVFGRGKFDVRGAAVYRHTTTSHVLYRSHRNRHIGVVADGRRAVWGVAFDGEEWTSLRFEDRRLLGLLRQFIRHDIYVQKIYNHLQPEMEEAFGIGLEKLVELDKPLSEFVQGERTARSAG